MIRPLSPPSDLRKLFPTPVAIGAMSPCISAHDLPVEERAIIYRAVEKRKREFATGRTVARRLLADLGITCRAIGRHSDHSPNWPPGSIGSISHCDDMCVVAVARTIEGFRSLGVDVEPAEPLPVDIWAEVACADELAAARECTDVGIAMRRLFSAKEALYKCAFPRTKGINFLTLGVAFGNTSADDSSVCTIEIDDRSFPDSTSEFTGRQIIWKSWIVSGFVRKKGGVIPYTSNLLVHAD